MYEDEPVLQAFKLMRKKRVGGVPIIETGGNRAVGNISLRDIHFLLTAPEIYHDYRFVTNILMFFWPLLIVRQSLKRNKNDYDSLKFSI